MGWAEKKNHKAYRDYYERTGHGMLVFKQNMTMLQNNYMLMLEALKEGVITKDEFRDTWFEELVLPATSEDEPT